MEFTVVRPDGSVRQVEGRAIPTRLGVDDVVVFSVVDVTEARATAAALRDMAFRDALTSIANRRALLEHLEERFERQVPTSVLFCDLNGFKEVNDRFGHAAGDAVLVEVAELLVSSVRPEDFVARFAGDEFVVVVDPPLASSVADRIADRLVSAPLGPSGCRAVSASIGVADMDVGSGDAEDAVRDVLSRSDRAMYDVKLRRPSLPVVESC